MTDTTKRAELVVLADEFDDIEVDAEGKCHWTAVANAQMHLRAQLRRLAAQDQKPVAWGRVIGGKAITISRERTPANDTPLYTSAPPPAAGWDEALRSLMKAGKIMAVCELCSSSYPEGCGHYDLDDLRETPDGAWVCENCWDSSGDNPIWEDLSHVESLRTTPAATKSADAGVRVKPPLGKFAQWVEREKDGKTITLWMRTASGTHFRYSVLIDSGYGDVFGELEAALSHQPLAVAANASAEARLRDHLGIVLSALRMHEEATGESFDDEGGDIAQIEREYNSLSPDPHASAEARMREAKLTSEELLAYISDQRRRYQTVILKPDQIDMLLAAIWAERTLRIEATREAYRTGWYINAAEAGDGEDQHPADYLARCEEVDWQEYSKALSPDPHASDCEKQGGMGDISPGDPKDLQELLSTPSVLEPSDRTADVTVERAQLWRHKKRGTTYRILHNNAPMQEEQTEGRRFDGEPMVVYQDINSGGVYVRPVVEFYDGRFEALPL